MPYRHRWAAGADRLDASRPRDTEEALSETFPGAAADDVVRVVAPAPRLLIVECVELRVLLVHQAAWAGLCSRALEPNIFLEPGFALPLIQHVRHGQRPSFLLVWEDDDATSFGRLVGLLPLAPRRFPGDRVCRGFTDPQVCLGVPLLDRARATEVWAKALEWLGGKTGRAAFSLTLVPRDGAFFKLLLRGEVGGRCRLLYERRRACLPASAPTSEIACFRSAKRRKEMRRQRRRLADRGERALVSARTPAEVRRATERFLALEHGGWKGGRGNALLADPGLATFTRSMTRLLAHEGKCRIDSLEVDGRPVAMGIVVSANGGAYFWKTAFDERYAPLSPGVQLALAITETQLADEDVTMTDSCAAPDHPMIDRLWPDRLTLVDCLVDLHPDEPGRFARVYTLERLGRAAWQTAKAFGKRLRRPR